MFLAILHKKDKKESVIQDPSIQHKYLNFLHE